MLAPPTPQAALKREHLRLAASLDPFGAQKVYVRRVRALPEFGAAFFTAEVRARREHSSILQA